MELVEERMAQNPVDQFERWLRNAEEVGEFQPRAMALATVRPA
jgi:pyridoxine/pyridoxamine 5'-phosphate oxidase